MSDGRAALQLTDNDVFDGNPHWSPDGSRLVFTSDRDGGLEIYVMNADGSGTVQLTDDDVDNGAADWSPDGERIAFMSDRSGDREIYTMAADGSAPADVRGGEHRFMRERMRGQRSDRSCDVATGRHRCPLL